MKATDYKRFYETIERDAAEGYELACQLELVEDALDAIRMGKTVDEMAMDFKVRIEWDGDDEICIPDYITTTIPYKHVHNMLFATAESLRKRLKSRYYREVQTDAR